MCKKKQAILLPSLILLTTTVAIADPFPVNPTNMQSFINRTKPNVALAIDNSTHMDYVLPASFYDSKKFAKAPRRLDVIKDAALQVVNKYYNDFNWTISVLADGQRDKFWRRDSSPEGSGYVILPTVADCTLSFSTDSRWYCGWATPIGPSIDQPTALYNTIATTTFWALNFGKNYRNLIPGTMYDYTYEYGAAGGYSIWYKDKTFGLGIEEELGQTTIWGRDTEHSTDPITRRNNSPKNMKKIEFPKWWVGKQLLVPYSITNDRIIQDKGKNNDCGSYFPSELTDKLDLSKNPPTHRCLINQQISEITVRYADYLGYLYPNLVDYMADKIKYRCQETYIIVMTHGERLNDQWNVPAAKKYAFTSARTSGLDAEGKPWNGADFPKQFIKSYAVGFNFNYAYDYVFRQFEKNGGGRAIGANSFSDIMEALDEFVNEIRPNNTVVTSIPAVSSDPDNSGNHLTGIVRTNPNDWSADLMFYRSLTQKDKTLSAKYIADKATILASTSRGLINFSDTTAVTNAGLSRTDFNLNLNQSIENFVGWLIGTNRSDTSLGFRNRSVNLNSGKRFLGDVFNAGFVMMGQTNPIIKAPEYLSVGSNDGMLKVYKANSEFGKYLEGEDTEIPQLDASGNQKLDSNGNPLTFGACYITDASDGSLILDANGKKLRTQNRCNPSYDEDVYTYTFAYLPGLMKKEKNDNVLNTLIKRADVDYGFDRQASPEHQYNVDGGIFYRTTNKGQTFMVGTMGQGGRGAYALNISGVDQVTGTKIGLDAVASTWKAKVPLWDTSATSFGSAFSGSQNMGYTVGTPSIGRIAFKRDISGKPDINDDVRYIAAVSSGYHGTEGGPTLYIYDALGVNIALGKNTVANGAGKLIKKLTYTSSANLLNSLSSPILVDLDFDGVIDLAYAGDQNGNLYRFDFRGQSPDEWKVHLLYEGSPDKPITTAPTFSNYAGVNVVIFGTGSHLYESDFHPLKEQSIYGIFDNFDNVTVRKDDLIEQTISPYNTSTNQRLVSNNKITNQKGWFLNFTGGYGESVTSSPQEYNGTVFFTTNIIKNREQESADAVCFRPLIGPTSWIMQLNTRTGGTLSEKDTHIKNFVRDGGINLSGSEVLDQTLYQIVVTIKGLSPSLSSSGISISGNQLDTELNPNPTPIDPTTRCLEDAIITTGDQSLELSRCSDDKIGKPIRIYLHKRF